MELVYNLTSFSAMFSHKSLITAGLIALSGCSTIAAQPKPESQPALKTVESKDFLPGESVCQYMQRIGISDPMMWCDTERKRDQEWNEAWEKIERAVAKTLAEIYMLQIRGHVEYCLEEAGENNSIPSQSQRETCADRTLKLLDSNENFQQIDIDMRERIREAIWRQITEYKAK